MTNSILIYGPSLTATATPNERTIAEANGYTVIVKDATQWTNTPAAEFRTYKAIVFPDPHCTFPEPAPLFTADNTKATWAPVVSGPIVLIGTDPVYHDDGAKTPLDKTGPALLMRNAINFAASGANTGMYMSLSCYYAVATTSTTVPVLTPFASGRVPGERPRRSVERNVRHRRRRHG